MIGRADAVTLVDGTSFVISGSTGDIAQPGVTGLFMLDTRVLSRWSLAVNGAPVEVLSVIPNGPFSATFAGRIPDPELVDAPLSVIRRRHVGNGMREDLEIRNHGATEQSVVVELAVGADFANLFAVKAGRVGERLAGRLRSWVSDRSEVVISRGDVEGGVDACVIRASVPPDENHRVGTAVGPGSRTGSVVGGLLHRRCRCRRAETAHESCVWRVRGGCDPDQQAASVAWSGHPNRNRRRSTRVSTRIDLGRTWVRCASSTPIIPDRAVVAAGAPWFMTLFGRDSLLASWMALLARSRSCRGGPAGTRRGAGGVGRIR